MATTCNALGRESRSHRQRGVHGNESQCARPGIWATQTAIRREESQSGALYGTRWPLSGHGRGKK